MIDGSANCVAQIGGLYRAKSAVMGIVYLDACDVVRTRCGAALIWPGHTISGGKKMCGIVGYNGSRQAAPILLEGLSKLEYRGYDSAGIAARDGSSDVEIVKAKGRLKVLMEKTNDGPDAHGQLWNRPHALGYAWRTIRGECSSALFRRHECGCSPQWDHRKLSGSCAKSFQSRATGSTHRPTLR